MFKNRSVKLTFVKDPENAGTPIQPVIDPEKIEQIARRSVLDLTKLTVAAAATLMVLHTTLEIIEDKATSSKKD